MAVDVVARGMAAQALSSGGGGGGGGVDNLLWCTYQTTTYNEITEALAQGKLPVCKKGNDVYTYQGIASNKYVFTAVKNTVVSYVGVGSNDAWAVLSSFTVQSTGNMVQQIDVDSTDKQYPSAKATYDAIQGVVANYKTVEYTVTYADGSTGVIYNVEATGGAQSQSKDQTATEPVAMESDPEHENEVV